MHQETSISQGMLHGGNFCPSGFVGAWCAYTHAAREKNLTEALHLESQINGFCSYRHDVQFATLE